MYVRLIGLSLLLVSVTRADEKPNQVPVGPHSQVVQVAPQPRAVLAKTRFEILVERLGSDSFEERERATKDLKEAGVAALPALEEAYGTMKEKDPEIFSRVKTLIGFLSEKGDLKVTWPQLEKGFMKRALALDSYALLKELAPLLFEKFKAIHSLLPEGKAIPDLYPVLKKILTDFGMTEISPSVNGWKTEKAINNNPHNTNSVEAIGTWRGTEFYVVFDTKTKRLEVRPMELRSFAASELVVPGTRLPNGKSVEDVHMNFGAWPNATGKLDGAPTYTWDSLHPYWYGNRVSDLRKAYYLDLGTLLKLDEKGWADFGKSHDLNLDELRVGLKYHPYANYGSKP